MRVNGQAYKRAVNVAFAFCPCNGNQLLEQQIHTFFASFQNSSGIIAFPTGASVNVGGPDLTKSHI
jgi:hypothetical protein